MIPTIQRMMRNRRNMEKPHSGCQKQPDYRGDVQCDILRAFQALSFIARLIRSSTVSINQTPGFIDPDTVMHLNLSLGLAIQTLSIFQSNTRPSHDCVSPLAPRLVHASVAPLHYHRLALRPVLRQRADRNPHPLG